jgi:DNA-directed RNA polymerase beta' subunit
MKLKLLNVDQFTKNLTPVETTELKTRAGELHPEGLFSEKIFGIEGSLDRSKKFSYIKLNAFVVHPAAYKLLIRIDRRLEKFMNTQESFSLNSNGELIIDENGVNGIDEFIKLYPDMKLKGGTQARDKIIKVIDDSYKQGSLFIDKLPVIPPDLRPMFVDEDGNLNVDDLNNLYINIMRKASQVKSIGKGSPLYNLLNFYLQSAINDHDKYVRTKISKKSGLIRANMLGKRVDFSARGVITPGPKLKINEVGVPLRMAVTIFQPFLIHYILYSKKYPYLKDLEEEIKAYTESELSVDTLNRVIKSIKDGDKISEKLYNLFFDATEIVIKGRVVILKRDPALHDGSYRAFNPILVNGDTIQLCTAQVGSFNADFDGDQMAIFHPLSREAQQEAKDKMMRGQGSKHSNHVVYDLSKEMCVGLYMMTANKPKTNSPISVTEKDLEKATDPYIRVKYKGKVTTMGRAIFNSAFPRQHPLIDTQVSKKVVNGMITEIIDKYGEDVSREVFSKLEQIAFKFATVMGPSLTIDILEMPDSILRIKEKLKNASPEEADKLLKQAEKLMVEHLKDTGLYNYIESGAGKGWGQPRQILVAKGVITDPKGNILPPIEGSFADGLKPTEYFAASAGARKGMADRALNTAETGYFTRQLVYVLGPAEASATVRDCKTKRTISIRLTNDIIKRLTGRYVEYGGRLVEFDKSKFKAGDPINLRSVIYCESPKYCHTCYGKLLRRHKTPYVGILAGASIGERGTQLIMQTFHTGGAAKVAERDITGDILNNDPLINVNLKKYLLQTDNKLLTNKPAKLTIDLTNYTMNDNIQINEDHVWVNHLLSKIEYDDTIFNLILDYPVHLKKIKMEVFGKERIEFNYISDDIILDVPFAVTEIKDQVNYVHRLLGGKVVYKDPGHLIKKIMSVYGGGVSDLDLVHFEVLISQTLRDKSNPQLPARLGKIWDPVMMNIKNAVFQSGFIQGLAFENVNKAIETGLISEGELEPSILGKLITGEVGK